MRTLRESAEVLTKHRYRNRKWTVLHKWCRNNAKVPVRVIIDGAELPDFGQPEFTRFEADAIATALEAKSAS